MIIEVGTKLKDSRNRILYVKRIWFEKYLSGWKTIIQVVDKYNCLEEYFASDIGYELNIEENE